MSEPKHNAETHPRDREWQRGTELLLTGIVIGVFGLLFGVVFIPEDLRAGSDFWIIIATLETLLAVGLIVAGFAMKHRASLERALEQQEQ